MYILFYLIFEFPSFLILKKWSMLGVHLSSYGCTREVGRAREKRLSGTTRTYWMIRTIEKVIVHVQSEKNSIQ